MDRPVYSLLLPPPNLTGFLHLGHMWNAILQDVLVRYYTIAGYDVRWFCGVDHAGLSLQIKVEEHLRSKGIDPTLISPEELDLELFNWSQKHREIIVDQYKSLNLLLPDISEWRYTLDEESKALVKDVLLFLCEQKLIYRAKKLVNWDPQLNTVISDSEISKRQINKKLYRVKYFFKNHPSIFVEVDTTRPETIYADIAITIHPSSEQYLAFPQEIKEKLSNFEVLELINPLNRNPLYLFVDDKMTKSDFGTGAVKRTPAHDPNDYQWWEENRHLFKNLNYYSVDELPEIFNEDTFDWNKQRLIDAVFEILEKKHQIYISNSNYLADIPISTKTGIPAENILSYQIFLRTTQIIKEILKNSNFLEKINIFPQTQKNILMEIFNNTKDWCISRQIRWGINVSWSYDDLGNIYSCSFDDSKSESLDTWFSSGIWNLICNKYTTISTLISGKDIMFPWISKMIFMHMYLSKNLTVSFQNIYLHGLILDDQRRKMSKSLGNGIDPLDLIKKYDLDLIRLSFIFNTSGSNNILFSHKIIEEHSKFFHKLKNAYTFISNREPNLSFVDFDETSINENEKCFLNNLHSFLDEYDRNIKTFSFSNLAKKTIDFIWNIFCNCYLEIYRLIADSNYLKNTSGFLAYAWHQILRILYPIMPNFVESTRKSNLVFDQISSSDANFSFFYDYMKLFTELRKKWSISWSQILIVNIYLESKNTYLENLINYFYIINQKVQILYGQNPPSNQNSLLLFIESISAVVEIPMISSNEKEKYLDFCQNTFLKISSSKQIFEDKLLDSNFVSKASSEIIDYYRDTLAEYQKQYDFYSWIIKENNR